jgi:hypothetical protein
MNGQNLANSSNTTSRRELDFYPTPSNVTESLVHFLKLPSDITVWECACGDGSMSEVLKKYFKNVVSTDLRHTGYGIGGIDFLKRTMTVGAQAIITNPPFNVSEQFILKALNEAPIVAMLLKSQYWHAAKRTKLFEDNPPAYILALTWRPDFMGGERGGAPTMECLWTVWIKGQTDTKFGLLKKDNQEALF